MTCHQALMLLDDFVDGELNVGSAGELHQHLATCPGCQDEYLATKKLKELMKRANPADPGQDYWIQTSHLIMARSVEADRAMPTVQTDSDRKAASRDAFVRAAMSLAASIAIFLSAVFIGENQQTTTWIGDASNDNSGLLIASSVVGQLGPNSAIYAESDQVRLAHAMLLIGPPGRFGRVAMLAELSAPSPRKK